MRQFSWLLISAWLLAPTGCAGLQPTHPGLSRHEPAKPRASDKPTGRQMRYRLAKAVAGAEAPAAEQFALAAQAEGTPFLAMVEPRKVIYTGSFEVLTADVEKALQEVRSMAEGIGGYMQMMTANSITVRVPAEKFDQAVADLEKTGTITKKHISAQDVTERYTDLEIRLKNARALLVKLRNLLEKARTVKEALEVEREIARVTTEVERLEGQLNRLRNQIAYATLSIRFVPIADAPDELKVKLPFPWLKELGLKNLLNLPHLQHLQ